MTGGHKLNSAPDHPSIDQPDEVKAFRARQELSRRYELRARITRAHADQQF